MKGIIFKSILFILIIISLITCRIEPEEPNDLNNIVILNNDYTGIDLYYVNNPYATSIIIKNISDKLIIELNYSINDNNFYLIKLLLPKEKFILYSTTKNDLTIVCNIELVIFY